MGHCLDQRSASCWGDRLHCDAAAAETLLHALRERNPGTFCSEDAASSVELSAPPELMLRRWGAAGAHVRTGQSLVPLHVEVAQPRCIPQQVVLPGGRLLAGAAVQSQRLLAQERLTASDRVRLTLAVRQLTAEALHLALNRQQQAAGMIHWVAGARMGMTGAAERQSLRCAAWNWECC